MSQLSHPLEQINSCLLPHRVVEGLNELILLMKYEGKDVCDFVILQSCASVCGHLAA